VTRRLMIVRTDGAICTRATRSFFHCAYRVS